MRNNKGAEICGKEEKKVSEEKKEKRMAKEKPEKKKKEHRGWRIFFRCVMIFFLLLVATLLVLGLVFAIYVDRKIEKHIDESLFTMVGSDSSTSIYYYDFSDRTQGDGIAVEIGDADLYGSYRCIYVDYDRIPERLTQAFVSIEDKRFFEHDGVDWKRTVSAGVNYFLKFNGNYGGSTITQQLIKNVTDKDDYSFQRKIQEIFWALDLETKMDKSEILGLYLNIINLSQGCYGVQTAANYYFSKDVSELTLSECAAIAAITNNPSYYDPVRNPEHNQKRRDLILSEMQKQGYITEEKYRESVEEETVLHLNEKMRQNSVNSWYIDMVVEDVIGDLMEQKGYSRTMASLMIYTGGLDIYTAMDPEIQAVLEKYYAQTSHFYSGTPQEAPQSSMIVIDPQTGDVLGVAGAVGAKNANRIQNFATQTVRPAGSVIKPLSVYAPALEAGEISWSSVYDDVPVNFGRYNTDPAKGELVTPVPWPQNSERIYRGLTNVNYALEHSVNTVTVRILEEYGKEKSFDFLYRKLHMNSLIPGKVLADGTYISDTGAAALALGQFHYGVTLRETTAAYSIFANDGVYNAPRTYYKVTDEYGCVILENPYSGEAVLREDTASLMTLMLENVVKNGTAKEITLSGQIECAGKTGTTQNNCDRWFIGYTPQLICGVWYGYEYPKPLTGVTGNPCVRLWDEVMTLLYQKGLDGGSAESEALEKFRLSDNLVTAEYCMDSGKKMTEACRRDPRGNRCEVGYFVRGEEPQEYCDCHLLVDYDSRTGGIVTDRCGKQDVVQVGLIRVERRFPIQIYVTDAQYVWQELGDEMPETSPALPFYQTLLKDGEFCGISRADVQYNRCCREHFDYFEWKKKHDGG